MVHGGQEPLRSFCADLRLMWSEAGGPSLRVLERQLSLSKSQVGAILGGRIRRPPDWRVVSTLVESFHRYAVEHGRADRLSLRTGVEEYWRPRFALLEHAFAEPRERAPEPASTVPAQLPPATAGFAGRRDVLAVLDELLATRAELGPAVLITAIGGTPGVGKTALALHWAHRNAGAFPDGQLYVNLRGFDPDGPPLGPAEVIRGFLDALGVAAQHVPADLSARVGLYRSLLADRRMLIVLDNAHDVGQVRPLLPGGVGSMVLVTSRDQLTPLVAAEGARSLTVDLLSGAEARELLERRLGRVLAAAEDTAVEEIIVRCARLPLALAVVAARAAITPGVPLSRLAEQLRDWAGRLDTLRGGDPASDVRTVISWSYHALSPGAARLFRLLGLQRSAEFGAAAAVSLAGDPLATTGLGELARAHLVTERSPGRYEFHDLLRAYAAEQAAAVDSAEARRAATHRLLDHYLHTAHRASVLMDPHRYLGSAPEPADPGVTPEETGDGDHALAWFTTEHRTLLAAIDQAAENDFPRHAWQLARATALYLYRRGHWHELIASHRTALSVAERAGDLAGQAHTWHNIADAEMAMARSPEARAGYETALRLFGEIADDDGRGVVHASLGAMAGFAGRHDEAIAHLRRSFELHRSTGRQVGQARALNLTGWCHAQLGDPAQAIHHLERAVTMQRQLGDTNGLAVTWHNLGDVHLTAGDHDSAIRCYWRSLDLFRAIGHRSSEASTLDGLGNAEHAAGNLDAAHLAWFEAVAIFDKLGHPEAARIRVKLDRPALEPRTNGSSMSKR